MQIYNNKNICIIKIILQTTYLLFGRENVNVHQSKKLNLLKFYKTHNLYKIKVKLKQISKIK